VRLEPNILTPRYNSQGKTLGSLGKSIFPGVRIWKVGRLFVMPFRLATDSKFRHRFLSQETWPRGSSLATGLDCRCQEVVKIIMPFLCHCLLAGGQFKNLLEGVGLGATLAGRLHGEPSPQFEGLGLDRVLKFSLKDLQ